MRWMKRAALLGLVISSVAAAGDPPPSLDQLAWMAGTWTGEEQGLRMLEHWTPPEGDLMLGLHRDVKAGKAVFFEFLRIERRADGIYYLAMPRGKPATAFRLVEVKGSRAVFENPKHDYPARILYWLTEDGSLHARTEGPDPKDPKPEEWTWTRAKG
jgi:hypothetical protein